jgi:23S rRNA (cytidine1920-2'-O)/16S rRNA (cytidine1409-2'-O)-methyltransferase
MSAKQRLDVLLHQRGLAPSREKARAMIMAGVVTVTGQIIDKPGTMVAVGSTIQVKAKPRFASRGGEKLDSALDEFQIEVYGRICADVGASTGGFTDCLLQHGAAYVYALDVGYGQLAYSLRRDSRVVVMERTNARYVERLPQPINLAVIDASFISLKLLLPVIKGWLASPGDIIALVKPQFEAGKKDVGKGGVVKDISVHKRVLEEVLRFAQSQQFAIRGLIVSPLKGPAGNIEFLAWFSWDRDVESLNIPSLVKSVVEL